MSINVFQIYKEGLNSETNVFEYDWFIIQRFDELNKQLFLSNFIKDKKERLQELRRILKLNPISSGYVPPREKLTFPTNGFDSLTELIKYQKDKTFFYGAWVELANVRMLSLEVYINDIFEDMPKKDEFEKISYLVDELFKYHSGVLGNDKADLAFRSEYNALIAKCIRLKINEINTTPIMDYTEQIGKVINRTLEWKAQKNIIGTLFGMLHNVNAIKGTKADLARALVAMFPNLSESTLKDNLNLKINTDLDQNRYSEKTENLLSEFMEFVKSTTK